MDGIRSIYGEDLGSVVPILDDGGTLDDGGSDNGSDANDLTVAFEVGPAPLKSFSIEDLTAQI